MRLKYPAILHEEDGGYWAEFPDFPGCVTEGDTLKEVLKNAQEALNLHIEGEPDVGHALPQASEVSADHVYWIDVHFQVAIAILLKQARLANHMTQKQIADKLGMHQQAYQRIESGNNKNLKVETLIKLEDALGVKLLNF